jgi:plasmid stabilization system protein ParE
MTYQLAVSDEAEHDILEAKFWYEDQQFGLGEKFVEEVERQIQKIVNNPNAYQYRYRDVRVCFTRKFPFGVHYLVVHSEILVLAVFHTSRDPKSWFKRIYNATV